MMRSPPPPVPQQSTQQVNSYGNPYQSPPGAGGGGGGGTGAGGGGFGGPGFNFMNDPTAQMGFQVGQHAMKAGQDYVEQNVRWIPCGTNPRLSSRAGYIVGSREEEHDILTAPRTDQPLCLHIGIKTILQRLQLICGAETADGAVPLAS